MELENPTAAAETAYATAHAAHYKEQDLRLALELYETLILTHPETAEAGYSRSQIQNIVRALVPTEELQEAQLKLAQDQLGRDADR